MGPVASLVGDSPLRAGEDPPGGVFRSAAVDDLPRLKGGTGSIAPDGSESLDGGHEGDLEASP
jgi:hypothetical protein